MHKTTEECVTKENFKSAQNSNNKILNTHKKCYHNRKNDVVITQLDEVNVAKDITQLLNHLRSRLAFEPKPLKPIKLKLENKEFFKPPKVEQKKANDKVKSSLVIKKISRTTNSNVKTNKKLLLPLKNLPKNVALNNKNQAVKPQDKKEVNTKPVPDPKIAPNQIANKTLGEKIIVKTLSSTIKKSDENLTKINTEEPESSGKTHGLKKHELEPFLDPELRPLTKSRAGSNRSEKNKFDLLAIKNLDSKEFNKIKAEVTLFKTGELIEEALKPCNSENLPIPPFATAGNPLIQNEKTGNITPEKPLILQKSNTVPPNKIFSSSLPKDSKSIPTSNKTARDSSQTNSNCNANIFPNSLHQFKPPMIPNKKMNNNNSNNQIYKSKISQQNFMKSKTKITKSSESEPRRFSLQTALNRGSKTITKRHPTDIITLPKTSSKLSNRKSDYYSNYLKKSSSKSFQRTISKTKGILSPSTRDSSLDRKGAGQQENTKLYPILRSVNSRLSSYSQSSQHHRFNHRRADRSLQSLSSLRPTTSTRFSSDPLQQLKKEVAQAVYKHKTFTVRGNFPAIRRALLRRGWVEKYHPTYRERLQREIKPLRDQSVQELVSLLHIKDITDVCKRLIKSKLLGNHQVDLYWGINFDAFAINPDRVKLTKINKFRRDMFSYTSKQGLAEAARYAYWFHFPGVASINHPRTYALSKSQETNDFVLDFYRTAAISLLKWVDRNYKTKECKLISPSGKIPLEAFQFAANECYKLSISARNEDLDQPVREATEREWTQFLQYFYKVLHIGNHFKATRLETEESIVSKARYLLANLRPHWPHMDMDGLMNIWILKPTSGSRGMGIHICRTLQYIMQVIKEHPNIRYVAQKYIERPLLIFNTKFDIRQWFLISSASPLIIWMYKECYLRFSSQTYNLRKLHESIHLTNNSIQSRYQNASRDITLPSYNMWDSNQFRNYLSNIGYPDIYQRVIYTGMKEGITAAVLMHQDKIDKRKNCFELYGADFMLTEDFKPWLIEINSSPALTPSTPITSRMCPQVLDDVIKVVVDYAANNKSSTGKFELIYKQKPDQCNLKNLVGLKLSGKPLSPKYFCQQNMPNSKVQPSAPPLKSLNSEQVALIHSKKSNIEFISKDMKKALESLLKFVQSENLRKKVPNVQEKHVPTQTSVVMSNCDSYTTTSSISFDHLKDHLEMACKNRSDIFINEQDEALIDEALKILKNKKKKTVIKFLIRVIERMIKRIKERDEMEQNIYIKGDTEKQKI